MDTGDVTDSGVTTIQIDTQKQRLSSDKDKQRWWDAFTAEDVDRLLEIGNRGRWNAYTAEDMDKMWQLGPARRRSFRRGSYERRYFQTCIKEVFSRYFHIAVKAKRWVGQPRSQGLLSV